MAFPDSDMQVTVKVYLGADPTADPGTWPAPTDLTSRLLGQPVSVTTGRRQNQRTAAAGQCSFWLDNHDGFLTPLHGASPYYGTWDIGAPVAVDATNLPPNPATVYPQFRGYIASIEVAMIPGVGGKSTSVVKVTLGGIMRRLGQGAVAKSAPRRTFLGANATTAPRAYWEMDTPNSPIPGVDPMVINNGLVAWEAGELSSHLPSGLRISSSFGTVSGSVDIAGSAAATDLMVKGQPGTTGSTFQIGHARSDPLAPWAVFAFGDWNAGSPTILLVSSGAISVPGSAELARAFWDNRPHVWRIKVEQDGADADVTLYLDGAQVLTGTDPGVTVSSRVEIVAGGGDGVTLGQATVWDGAIPTADSVAQAMFGYAGERAYVRIGRVCAEEGIPFSAPVTSGSALCGPQPHGDILAALRDAEAVDNGMLTELLTTWGFGYRALSLRYNLAPAMTIDLATYRVSSGSPPQDVLTPVRNDQRIRNEWTVSRPGGGSVTVKDEASIAKRGRYDDSAEVNVSSDVQLLNYASWRVNDGTTDTQRYQSMPIDIGANPASPSNLLTAWLGLDLGDRIDRINHLSQHPSQTVSLSLEGYTSTMRNRGWTVDAVVEPYDLLRDVMVAANPTSPGSDPSRAAHPGSTLALNRSANDTSIPVTNVPAAQWGTADLPYDLNIAGERVTCTAVSGSGLSQTLTVTRSVNGVSKSQAAGTSVQIWRPVHAAQ